MIPFMSLLLPIVVSAVAVFVLTMIIHMTPWHRGDYIRLPDEDGVIVSADPSVAYEHVVAAMDALRRRGNRILFDKVLISAGVR